MLLCVLIVIAHLVDARKATPAPVQAEAPSVRPAAPVSHAKLIDMVGQRVAYFRREEKRTLIPEINRAFSGFFGGCESRIETFLDWQYSYRAKFNGAWNGVCNVCEKGGNWAKSLLGYETRPAIDRNEVMCREKFAELVLSESQLTGCIGEASDRFQSTLVRHSMDFITQLNVDLSKALSREFGIQMSEQEIQKAFSIMLDRLRLSSELQKGVGSAVIGVLAAEYIGASAGAFVEMAMKTWMVGTWYAQLSTSGQIMAYMGLIQAPTSMLTGAVGGAVSMGVGLLAMAAVDWVFEWYTRPDVKAKIVSSLRGLHAGLWSGSATAKGMSALCDEAIDDVSDAIERLYRQAIEQVLRERGLIS